MFQIPVPRALAALATAFLLAMLLIVLAAPGHAAGDPPDGHIHAGEETVAPGAGPPTAEADGSLYEAVLELAGDHLLIWMDDRATNAPAPPGTRLTVTVGERDLAVRSIEPGTFRAELPELPAVPFVVALAVESAAGADLMEATLRPVADGADEHHHALDWRSAAIGAGAVLLVLLLFGAVRALLRRRDTGIVVALALVVAASAAQPLRAAGDPTDGHTHGDEPAGAGLAGNRPQRLGDGQLFLPKPSQRIMGVRTVVVSNGSGAPAVRIAGRVSADPSRTAQVATAAGGRLDPIAGAFPRVGQAVRAGEPLLAVRPALDAAAAQASASELRALDR
jgi:hypothetical protein